MVPRVQSMPPITAPTISPLDSSARCAVVVSCINTRCKNRASCQSQNDTSSKLRKNRSSRSASLTMARRSRTCCAVAAMGSSCSANNVESGPGPREGNRQYLPIRHLVAVGVAGRRNVMTHVAVEEECSVENFLVSRRRQLFFLGAVQSALRPGDIIAPPEMHAAERIPVAMNALGGNFQLLARFDLDADLMDLALPDFIVQFRRQNVFVHIEIRVDQAAHHRGVDHFVRKVLEVSLQPADITVVGLGLNIGPVFELLEVTGPRVVFEIAVATKTHARLGLAVISVRLHVFPTLGQPDEVGEITVEI